MANDAKKVSELAVTTTLSANDRVVILSNPSTAANVKTITATNFVAGLVSSGSIPVANTTQLGVVKVDGTTITISNGTISGASVFNQQLNSNSSVTFASVTTTNISSQNSVTINVGNNAYNWTYLANGQLNASGDIIPTANDVYTLGNSSLRWNALWVGGNSIIFADSNPSFPDQVLTVSNGIFNITEAGVASRAGLRVGNFTLVDQSILLANTFANIEIGTIGSVAPINFNRPITVRSGTGVWDTLSVDPIGRVNIISDTAENPIQAAMSITSSRTRSISFPNLAGVLCQLSGSSLSPTRFFVDSYGNGYSAFIGRHARGPSESPTPVLAGDTIARFGANPYGSDGFAPISTVRMDFLVRENQTSNNKGSEIQFWTTANSSNTIAKRLTINEDGLTYADGSKQNTAFSNTSAVTKINVGTGLTQTANVGIVGIDATGVLSVAGTNNQILVANSGQNITLSLPQNIGTNSTVQFNTLTVQNLTITGNTTIANTASVADKILQLAYDSSNSAQIDGGGITLGNTSEPYHVSFLYNLSQDYWDTNGAGLKTLQIVAANVTTNTVWIDNKLHVGGAYAGYDFPDATIQADCNNNGYNQTVLKNHNNGTQASADFVAVNDVGNDSNNYIDLGINSSTYANADYSIVGPNDGYLYVNGGDLAIGTQTTNTNLIFFAGGTTSGDRIGSANTSGWFIDRLTVSNTINGTANNVAFVGTISAANVVSNAQLQSNLANYQTTAGLAANLSSLSANSATYLGNSSGTLANIASWITGNSATAYSNAIANFSGAYQTTAGLAANVVTLIANNTNFVGSVSAANVVSNNQLQSNLISYQTIVGLSSNVITLTANAANFIGTLPAANVVSNAQLQGNLANYISSTQLSSNLANYQTTAGLSANVITLTANAANFIGTLPAANVVSNAQLQGNLALYVTGTNLTSNLTNYQTTAGLAANVATLTANAANFIGTLPAANVVSNAQLQSNLANYQTTAGLNANVSALGYTNTAGSYTITGVHTYNANVVIGSTAGIVANGAVGTAGQHLTSNGSSVYWSTPIPQTSVFVLNSDRALLNQSALQSALGVGITLASSTRYKYRFIAAVFKSSTLGTYAITYALGGTAAPSLHFFMVNPCDGASQETPTATLQMSARRTANFSTATTISGTNSGTTWYSVIVDGVIDITTGGTLIPEIGFTGTPGSSSLIQQGASFEIWPISATGSNTNVGGWA